MCKHGTSTEIQTVASGAVLIDFCIAGLVQYLNKSGVQTIGCCCGHYRINPTVRFISSETEVFSVAQLTMSRKDFRLLDLAKIWLYREGVWQDPVWELVFAISRPICPTCGNEIGCTQYCADCEYFQSTYLGTVANRGRGK